MDGNLSGYNANDFEPAGDFSPIPEGEYKAFIAASTFKPTKAGDGKYLELTLQVMEGPYIGRQVWDRLNLDNPSDKAVSIARSQLSSICRAVGKMTPNDSSQLHNLPMLVRIALETRQDNGEPANRVKGYKSLKPAEGESKAADRPTSRPDQPAPTAAGKTGTNGSGKKAPWER